MNINLKKDNEIIESNQYEHTIVQGSGNNEEDDVFKLLTMHRKLKVRPL